MWHGLVPVMIQIRAMTRCSGCHGHTSKDLNPESIRMSGLRLREVPQAAMASWLASRIVARAARSIWRTRSAVMPHTLPMSASLA